MIPYFQFLTISLGPITLQVWGLFVAFGILIGAWTAARMAKRRGLDQAIVWDVAVWVVVGSMIGARLFHVLVYDPQTYLWDPIQIFMIWKGGLSMFGGLIGATIAGVWYLRRKKLNLLLWCDTLMFGLPIGIGIGRIGCFLIHDHPGTLTHFLLGVRFPDGIRHDLGLYESIYGFALAIVFFFLAKKDAKPPTYLITFLISYGAFRLFSDFFRLLDTKYFHLTPAQYLSIILFVAGVTLWKKHSNQF